jgi:methylated-DNA-[protein]-cysteine S-methyltransferase
MMVSTPDVAAVGFALFESAIGWCGIAWTEGAIAGVQLPESSQAASKARLLRRFPGLSESAPPRHAELAISGIVRLLSGECIDLGDIPLELDRLPAFNRRVYEVAQTIPPGTTLTYGEVARRIGEVDSARAVGKALGENPFPIVIPCHRVTGAGGKLGGFSAPGGRDTKVRILEIERGTQGGGLPLFDGSVT